MLVSGGDGLGANLGSVWDDEDERGGKKGRSLRFRMVGSGEHDCLCGLWRLRL